MEERTTYRSCRRLRGERQQGYKRELLAPCVELGWGIHILHGTQLPCFISRRCSAALFHLHFWRRYWWKQGLSFGAVWTVYHIAQRLGIAQVLGATREGKLALWQVIARVIDQGSRLSAVRLAMSHAACDVLGLDTFDEDALYENLDWLAGAQARIEDRLFAQRQKTKPASLFLYDVTRSYLEGTHNALAAFGYNRDGKKGKLQIVIGLLCDEDGHPVSIEVCPGNTPDPQTLAAQVTKLKDRFGVHEMTFVGDRGMIKSQQIDDLAQQGFHYITAITKPQIEKLLRTGTFQMELFEQELAEVRAEEGVRYVLRRNPMRAQEMRATRGLDHRIGHLALVRPQKNEQPTPIEVETRGRPRHPSPSS